MATFSDLVDKIEHLSEGEIIELKSILEKKWIEIRRDQIAAEIEEAGIANINGNTTNLKTAEEIRNYFTNFLKDGN